ncbi:hypothetical protein [Vreelandella lionensis]
MTQVVPPLDADLPAVEEYRKRWQSMRQTLPPTLSLWKATLRPSCLYPV